MTVEKRAKQQKRTSGAKSQQRKGVNPRDKAGDIPPVKYDVHGELILMVYGANYVMCRRPGCYPMIRTVKEWRALSDAPAIWAAADGETFHRNNSSVSDQSKTEPS